MSTLTPEQLALISAELRNDAVKRLDALSVAPARAAQTGVKEGDVKITVANNSWQADGFFDGAWQINRVGDAAGLPRGVYRLSDAAKPAPSAQDRTYSGPALYADDRNVYQVGAEGVVQHARNLFPNTPVVGRHYEVSYQHGIGTVAGDLTAAQPAPTQARRPRSR